MRLGGREQISRAVALARLPESVEDGLLQLQLRTMECAAWREMVAVYDGMLEIFETAAAPSAHLLDRLRRDRGALEGARSGVERLQRSYSDAYEQSRQALRVPRLLPSLVDRIAQLPATVRHAEAVRALQRVLAVRFADFEFGDERAVASVVELLFHYLLAEQGLVAVAAAAELHSGELQSSRRRRPPALLQTPDLLGVLEEELGVRVEYKPSGIDVTDLRARANSAAP